MPDDFPRIPRIAPLRGADDPDTWRAAQSNWDQVAGRAFDCLVGDCDGHVQLAAQANGLASHVARCSAAAQHVHILHYWPPEPRAGVDLPFPLPPLDHVPTRAQLLAELRALELGGGIDWDALRERLHPLDPATDPVDRGQDAGQDAGPDA